MASWKRYPDAYWCSTWPFCAPRCCVASCGLSIRLAILWKTAICPRLPLRYKTTGIYITLFVTRCSPCLYYEADSDILPFSKFHLFYLFSWNVGTNSYASMLCYMFGISEYTLKDICHHLHVVISYEVSYDLLGSIDPRIDLAQPRYDQDQWLHPDKLIINHILGVHGTCLSQILLRFPPRSHSLWCLLCQHSCLLLYIPRSYDSRSPSLCIKLCCWRLKHVFHTW